MENSIQKVYLIIIFSIPMFQKPIQNKPLHPHLITLNLDSISTISGEKETSHMVRTPRC